MRVLMISPGFPDDMPLFTRGLARVGAQVIGIGDQPQPAADVASALIAYLPIANLWDEDNTVETVASWLAAHHATVDRVECLWEPGVVLAAKLRARLGVAGLSIDQAVAFRDKETMKQVLDAAGIRTPHHYRAQTRVEVSEAALERFQVHGNSTMIHALQILIDTAPQALEQERSAGDDDGR